MGKSIGPSALALAISLAVAAAAHAQNGPSDTASEGTPNSEAHEHAPLVRYLGTPLASELSPGAAAALERFGPFAAERGYTGHLSPDQSVLFFALARRSAGSELALVEAVERRFHEYLPEPRSRHPGPLTGTGGPTRRVYPIGGDVPAWKHDLPEVGEHCGVLFELDSDEHYDELLAYVGGTPTRHLGEPGRSFLTRDVGAWLWRVGSVPDAHQLVQGAAQQVLERRFPYQPEWLRDGLAWHVERDVLGSVRCLLESRGESSRDFALEWEAAERVRPFEGTWVERLERLVDWQPGKGHVELAGQAFAFVGELLEREPANLANAAEELRLYWEDHSVRHDPRQGWQRRWDYRTPLHVQGRVLAPLLDAPRLVRADAGVQAERGE